MGPRSTGWPVPSRRDAPVGSPSSWTGSCSGPPRANASRSCGVTGAPPGWCIRRGILRRDILDLSWTSHGVDRTGGYQPFDSSTIWNLQPRITPYNVTVGVGLTTEQTFLKKYVAYLGSSVEIIAPPSAQADGTTILFDLPTIAETIAPIIIVISLITAIGTFLLERRIS